MGTLYLVRHGQASFATDDYDRLSELGERQCRRLGEYLRSRGRRFEAVLRGTLRRHEQSLAALATGLGGAPQATLWPGLNEYDSAAVLRAIHPEPLAPSRDPEVYRQHFRMLRQGLAAWMEGRIAPEGMPSYADFAAGIAQVLDHVRRSCRGDVLVVSSGGPISTAIAQVIGLPATGSIELNMRLRNSAVSELVFTPKRHALSTFNHLPHLDAPEFESWITYT